MKILAQGTQNIKDVIGTVSPPPELQTFTQKGGAGGLSHFLNILMSVIFTAGAIIFIFMILYGAFQWISSGGEKDNIAAARKRLTHAIIGLVLLALAFLIVNTVGKITGFTFF